METTKANKRPFLSIQTVADELGLNPETIRRAVVRREIPSIQIGRCYRIPREVLDDWKRKAL
jgi:excisionase family DNA binding protein